MGYRDIPGYIAGYTYLYMCVCTYVCINAHTGVVACICTCIRLRFGEFPKRDVGMYI